MVVPSQHAVMSWAARAVCRRHDARGAAEILREVWRPVLSQKIHLAGQLRGYKKHMFSAYFPKTHLRFQDFRREHRFIFLEIQFLSFGDDREPGFRGDLHLEFPLACCPSYPLRCSDMSNFWLFASGRPYLYEKCNSKNILEKAFSSKMNISWSFLDILIFKIT